jgi:hypothetical protein
MVGMPLASTSRWLYAAGSTVDESEEYWLPSFPPSSNLYHVVVKCATFFNELMTFQRVLSRKGFPATTIAGVGF